jgi:hypothetical protein
MGGLVKFLCSVCRRERDQACHTLRLQCCGEEFRVCMEKCMEMIPRVSNGGQSVKDYVALYERIHKIVCKKKFEM